MHTTARAHSYPCAWEPSPEKENSSALGRTLHKEHALLSHHKHPLRLPRPLTLLPIDAFSSPRSVASSRFWIPCLGSTRPSLSLPERKRAPRGFVMPRRAQAHAAPPCSRQRCSRGQASYALLPPASPSTPQLDAVAMLEHLLQGGLTSADAH